MTTYNTGNPLGSAAAKDLYDNAENFDHLSNDQVNETWPDRLGKERLTWYGVEKKTMQALMNYGYITKDSFEDGSTLSLANECLRWKSNGEYYRWDGALPKVVPPGSTPDSTGGIGEGKWISVGDAALRTDLKKTGTTSGDSLIGTAGGLSQKDKNAEVPSIQDFGGRDDWNGTSGTDNTQAIVNAYSSGVRRLRMPKLNTGVYHFNNITSTVTNLNGLVLDNDPSIYIHHSSDNVLNLMKRPGWTSTSQIKNVIDGPTKYDQFVSNQMFRKPSEKKPDASFSGELHLPEILAFASSHTPQYFKATGWPTLSLAYTTSGFTIADSTTISFTAPSGQFWGAMFSVVPGDHLEASCRDGGQTAVVVETANGVVVARQNTSGTKNQISVNSVEAGVSTEKNFRNIGIIADPYWLSKSVLGVGIIDEKTFVVTCNGIVVAKVDTESEIISAGWGNGYASVAATISHPTRIRARKDYGVSPVSLVCVGDSTGDNAVTIESQFEFARDYIAGLAGCQVINFNNLSVRGETANQQKTRLLATDITGYSHCLIQVGINDIQGQTNMAGWLTQYVDMINYCKANNVTPIIGIPAMFYAQDDITDTGIVTSHIGQNTSNSDKGVLYRLNLARTASSNSVQVNYMGQSAMGQVIPQLLTMASDPVVMDNIHPSIFGSMQMGMSWARAVIADMTRANKKGTWLKSGSGAGGIGVCALPKRYLIANAGSTAVPRYTVDADGSLCTLSYYIRQDATWGNDAVVGTLPERLRPMTDQSFVVQPRDSSTVPVAGAIATVIISRSGDIRVIGMPSAAWFLPIGVTYRI
ncbi:hypothetical protein JX819_000960 [Citrobacter farmeri]